jgi:hypothetical protein
MDKGRIAEWFVSLVMDRPQATCVVGDLMEDGASRSAGWFWTNVFRICAASIWRDGKSEPRFVLGLAALGILLEVGLCFLGSVSIALVVGALASAVSLPLSIQDTRSFLLVRLLVIFLGSSFYAGRWVARYALGMEMAVCVAMVVIGPIAYNAFAVLIWSLCALTESPAPRLALGWWNWWVILSFVPRLLGATLARRQIQVRSPA